MNDDGILGATFGQLGQTVKQGVKQVVKIPQELAKDVGGQVGIAKQPQKTFENKPQQQWQSDEERVKFLKDLYGKKDMFKDEAANNKNINPSDKKPTEFQEQIADRSVEEQKKLVELRNQLHKENYYDPTFNPKNPPAGGEERPAEKVENEKKQEMQDLQKKEEKKPPPLAVARGQNKTEIFRGASG